MTGSPRGECPSHALQQDRDALADADAHGADGVASASVLELVGRRRGEPGPAHPERMPEGDGAAIRVPGFRPAGEPGVPENGRGLSPKGLVDLHDVDPADVETGASQELPGRR